MTKKQRKLVIGICIILAQVALLRDYLPFLSTKLLVKGMSCTCPDVEVIIGQAQLKAMTPDSLKKYDLDYSEIYFEEGISTPSDLMGVGYYSISGEVIGKESVSEGDGHNYPLFRIAHYTDATLFNLIRWLIPVLLLVELYVLYGLIKKKSDDK